MSDSDFRLRKLERTVSALMNERDVMGADVIALQALAMGLAEMIVRNSADGVAALEQLRRYCAHSRSQYEGTGRLTRAYEVIEEFLADIEATAMKEGR